MIYFIGKGKRRMPYNHDLRICCLTPEFHVD